MRHKKLWTAICISALAIASAIGVWAIVEAETSVENNVSTSIVDISLKNYTKVEDKIIPMDEKKDALVVMPGMKISQIPRITNKAINCYVRASIAIDNKNQVNHPITVEDISGFTTDWVKAGEYYYYTNIFETGSTIDMFDTISVPEEWDTQYTEGDEIRDYYTKNDWDITVKVDAIQAANFTPAFDKVNPWGEEGKDYEIQECIHEDGYDVTTFKANTPSELSVVYEGNSKKLITSQEDFFSGFSTLTPGDSIKGTFTLKNTADTNQSIFFKTEVMEPENNLLNKMELKIITSEGREIYSGSLNSNELKEYMELCKLDKDKVQNVTFHVSVPKELDNQYTLNTGKVKWYFKTVEETEKETEKANPAKTGDKLLIKAIIWGIILLVAIAVLIIIKIKKRKE